MTSGSRQRVGQRTAELGGNTLQACYLSRVVDTRSAEAQTLPARPTGPTLRTVGRDGRAHCVDLTPLHTLVQTIVARWRPEQIWLFGSRARGEARASSDWDLLVVVPDEVEPAEFDPLVGWRMQKDSGVRADVFPCRVSDFREDRETPNTLAFDAAVDGLLIYER